MERSILQRVDTRRIDAISDGLFPLAKRNRAYTLFHRVKEAMKHVPDFGETCKGILDAVMDEMDAENCSLMLRDPISGYLTVSAARGKNEKTSVFYADRSSNGKSFRPGEGIAGWVLQRGKSLMLNDVNKEPRFVRVVGFHHQVNSLICFPIREKDEVVGVFNLSHSRKGAFNEEDKYALSYISNQVGSALTSARFFLEIKEINRLMKDSKELLTREKVVPIASPSQTFVEIGEVTREEDIFLYASEKMRRIKEIIDQIANTDITVLLQGESGTGKEVVARSIHFNSLRREKPLVKVNCAALPQDLLESELFGYEKGAFTGAYRQKPGKFELANGGTIFLDEIAETSLSIQGKLLQALQDKEFSRLGGKKDVRVDVRVLVATNKNIEESVKNGQFREDLYYRLNVVNINIPPLRERREEIPLFIEYFLDKYSRKYQKGINPLSESALKIFSQYHWLGNVRELENMIQRLVVLGNIEAIVEELTTIPKDSISETTEKITPTNHHLLSLKEVNKDTLKRTEYEIIQKTLERTNWNRKKAAELLNISYKALLYKIKAIGLDKKFTIQIS